MIITIRALVKDIKSKKKTKKVTVIKVARYVLAGMLIAAVIVMVILGLAIRFININDKL